MNGIKEILVHLLSDAQGLESIEGLRMRQPSTRDTWSTDISHICRNLFKPSVEIGFESIAMGTAIPEKLPYFDLVTADRLRTGWQLHIMLARFILRSARSGHQVQRQHK